MNLKDIPTKKIKQIKESLIQHYVGVWDKPEKYFKEIQEIDDELELRIMLSSINPNM